MRIVSELSTRTRPSGFAVACVGVASAYLVALALAMERLSFDVWGGIVVAPILILLTVPLARSAARADRDNWSARLVMAAVVFKMLGAVLRYYVSFSIYGPADADRYNDYGRILSALFRQGIFTYDLGHRVAGTGFIEIVTGIVYTVIGTTNLGGFFVFSWFGFIGLFLLYRAFRIGFPDGDARRYGLLVFFLPSLLFWPSSIGKESWMMLNLGLIAYGAARLLAGRRFALPALVAGIAGSGMVRPHITLIAMLALFGAALLRRPPKPSLVGPVAKALLVAILGFGTLLVLSQMESFFGVRVLESQGADQVLERAASQSAQGGSEFEATRPSSPIGIGQAAVAVIFRPWPFEANNVQALFASLEGVFLLVLLLTSLSRLAAVPRAMLDRPYIAFALIYSVLFAYAFSAIGNFGILARQRVQFYPLLIVVLCVPADFITQRGRSRSRNRETQTTRAQSRRQSSPSREAARAPRRRGNK